MTSTAAITRGQIQRCSSASNREEQLKNHRNKSLTYFVLAVVTVASISLVLFTGKNHGLSHFFHTKDLKPLYKALIMLLPGCASAYLICLSLRHFCMWWKGVTIDETECHLNGDDSQTIRTEQAAPLRQETQVIANQTLLTVGFGEKLDITCDLRIENREKYNLYSVSRSGAVFLTLFGGRAEKKVSDRKFDVEIGEEDYKKAQDTLQKAVERTPDDFRIGNITTDKNVAEEWLKIEREGRGQRQAIAWGETGEATCWVLYIKEEMPGSFFTTCPLMVGEARKLGYKDEVTEWRISHNQKLLPKKPGESSISDTASSLSTCHITSNKGEVSKAREEGKLVQSYRWQLTKEGSEQKPANGYCEWMVVKISADQEEVEGHRNAYGEKSAKVTAWDENDNPVQWDLYQFVFKETQDSRTNTNAELSPASSAPTPEVVQQGATEVAGSIVEIDDGASYRFIRANVRKEKSLSKICQGKEGYTAEKLNGDEYNITLTGEAYEAFKEFYRQKHEGGEDGAGSTDLGN